MIGNKERLKKCIIDIAYDYHLYKIVLNFDLFNTNKKVILKEKGLKFIGIYIYHIILRVFYNYIINCQFPMIYICFVY